MKHKDIKAGMECALRGLTISAFRDFKDFRDLKTLTKVTVCSENRWSIDSYGVRVDNKYGTHVQVEYPNRSGGSTRDLVTFGQLVGPWADVGPAYEARVKAGKAKLVEVKAQSKTNRDRVDAVVARAKALGIDTWRVGNREAQMGVEDLERLVSMAEGHG